MILLAPHHKFSTIARYFFPSSIKSSISAFSYSVSLALEFWLFYLKSIWTYYRALSLSDSKPSMRSEISFLFHWSELSRCNAGTIFIIKYRATKRMLCFSVNWDRFTKRNESNNNRQRSQCWIFIFWFTVLIPCWKFLVFYCFSALSNLQKKQQNNHFFACFFSDAHLW